MIYDDPCQGATFAVEKDGSKITVDFSSMSYPVDDKTMAKFRDNIHEQVDVCLILYLNGRKPDA
jgi:hypothetical protein